MRKYNKVLIVMDSFKGCMSSAEAGKAVLQGITDAIPGISACIKPFADGGEGTMEAITGDNKRLISTEITYPDGTAGSSEYSVLDDGTVVIESAKAVGLTLVPEGRRDPMRLSSIGLGQLIMHAYSGGYRKYLITLGGSGTNDGGVGMLHAMGIRFRDSVGHDIDPIPECMTALSGIEIPYEFTQMVESCSFTVAADVNNPMCGPQGASYVFGPQKGLKEKDLQDADDILMTFGLTSDIALHKNNIYFPGGGAAGGLGFALVSYLNAELISGAMAVIKRGGIEELIAECDLVISGEGRMDAQTLMGKGTGILKSIADKYGKRVLYLAGSVTDADALENAGMEVYSIDPGGMTIEQLMDNRQAYINLKNKATEVISSLNLSD